MLPSIDHIRTRLSPDEEDKYLYSRGKILRVADEDYGYFAKVTADTHLNASEVFVQFFAKEIGEKLGNKVSINAVITKREKPENGWGTQKVLLQYFNGKTWIFSKDVTVFEYHYLLPESVNSERKMPSLR